jgi:hypothetical protein
VRKVLLPDTMSGAFWDLGLQTLSASVQSAVNTLTGLIATDNESLMRAVCNDILGHVLKYRELSEIEERLETVERIVLERRTYRP